MDDRGCNQAIPVKRSNVRRRGVRPKSDTRPSEEIHGIPDAVLGKVTVEEGREDHDDSSGYAAPETGGDGIAFDRKERPMNRANLNVRHTGSWAPLQESSGCDRDHVMALLGKNLPRPSPYAAEDENKAGDADTRTCHQARETKRDSEREENWPSRAGRHLNGFCRALLRIRSIRHDSPSDEVDDCKHNDPHRVYEVPIKGDHAKALTLPRVNPAEKGKN